MQFSPSLGECHGCASSSKNPAKPDRTAGGTEERRNGGTEERRNGGTEERRNGGTEAVLRYRCLHGHRAPCSFAQLLLPLLTAARIAPGRFEGRLGNSQALHVRFATIPQVRA